MSRTYSPPPSQIKVLRHFDNLHPDSYLAYQKANTNSIFASAYPPANR